MTKYKKQPSKEVPLHLIKSLTQQGFSQRQMLAALHDQGIKICRSTLRNRLADAAVSASHGTSGHAQKVTERNERYLSRLIRFRKVGSAPQLRKELINVGTNVCCSTVLRSLHKNPNLQLRRPRKRPFMTPRQQQQRLEWAKTAAFDWKAIYYGDEKSFKLDGPDFRRAEWCDRRDPAPTLPRKGPHQERIGFFGCFSLSSVPDLVPIPADYDSTDYTQALRQAVPVKSVLMHDRHPVHKSAMTQRCMKQRKVDSMLFPPCAADLNPMENLWGIMSSQVYGGNKVYQDRGTLAIACKQAWAAIQSDAKLIQSLVDSMPDRVAEVKRRKGHFAHY
jgi:hypothetical protein